MILSGLGKFLLGFILAIALLVGGGVSVALYFVSKVSTLPPKPIFANDTATVKAQSPTASTTAKNTTVSTTQPSAMPTPSETASPQPPLEPGTYEARVTWSEGLILRSEPNIDAERIGSAGYNQQITVLEESVDKNWQRIRLEDSEQEGWVKAGNIERVNQE